LKEFEMSKSAPAATTTEAVASTAIARIANPLALAIEAKTFNGARFALFNHTPETDDGRTHPVMRGLIENDGMKVDVAAFAAMADSGTPYLRLSLGNKDQVSVYGRLFRDAKKEGHYFGYIELSRPTGEIDSDGHKVYETVWKLNIRAERTKAKSGAKYIGGEVSLAGIKAAAVEADDVAF
jgi:hypothetical protein